MTGIAALLTDFGTADWYVGSMKGVMLGIDPTIRIVDITHGVPAGDILGGALALLSSYRYFPAGTVFVVVVDPGVGSERRGIVAAAGGYFFVGPDNGVLSPALARAEAPRAHAIENDRYTRPEVGATFHGRDVFAPVAAHLCSDPALERFGPRVDDPVGLSWPEPTETDGGIRGEIIHVDAFGNAITSIEAGRLGRFEPGEATVGCSSRGAIPLRDYYRQVGEGEPLALVGSSGLMEISVNRGNAARILNLARGDVVEVTGTRGPR
jgi:S-adenosylmethionine hydrolase